MFMDGTENDFCGTLYFDETNNFRKLALVEKGTNNPIENKSFVLGGLARTTQEPIQFDSLLKKLNLQKNAPEIKFKHISHKQADFLDILKSKRLLQIFKWINDDETLLIHSFSTNYFFYVLTDIVDEAFSIEANRPAIMFHLELKSALYDATKPNADFFLKQLYAFNYPKISSENVCTFIELLIDYIESRQYELLNEMEDFHTEFLRQLIKPLRKSESLDFFSKDDENTLFSEYALVYAQRVVPFENAKLIFDREYAIEDSIEDMLQDFDNFEFKDSKEDVGIQIADVIVGFISKLYSYVDGADIEQMLEDVNEMTQEQRLVLKLYFDLEERADKACRYLLQHIQPNSSREKMYQLQQMIRAFYYRK